MEGNIWYMLLFAFRDLWKEISGICCCSPSETYGRKYLVYVVVVRLPRPMEGNIYGRKYLVYVVVRLPRPMEGNIWYILGMGGGVPGEEGLGEVVSYTLLNTTFKIGKF